LGAFINADSPLSDLVAEAIVEIRLLREWVAFLTDVPVGAELAKRVECGLARTAHVRVVKLQCGVALIGSKRATT
jgi:hypothetical protein